MTLKISAMLVMLLMIMSYVRAADRTPDQLDTVKKLLAENKAVLVDVREQDEWDLGHLQGARHLPTSQIIRGVSTDELDRIVGRDTVIYLHCKAGKRAAECAKRLKMTGRDVRPLKTGYFGLLDAGFTKAEP